MAIMVVIRGNFPLQRSQVKVSILSKFSAWLKRVAKQSFRTFFQSIFRFISLISGTIYTVGFGLGLISLALVCLFAIVGQATHKPMDIKFWYKLAHFEWLLFPYWAIALVVSTVCTTESRIRARPLKKY